MLLALGRQPSVTAPASAHVRGFTRRGLLGFPEACFPDGYGLVAARGNNFYPFPPRFARPLARMFPSLAWGTFLMLKKEREYRRQFLDYPPRERLETNFYLG